MQHPRARGGQALLGWTIPSRPGVSSGRALLWVAAVLFVVYFAIDPIKQVLGVS